MNVLNRWKAGNQCFYDGHRAVIEKIILGRKLANLLICLNEANQDIKSWFPLTGVKFGDLLPVDSLPGTPGAGYESNPDSPGGGYESNPDSPGGGYESNPDSPGGGYESLAGDREACFQFGFIATYKPAGSARVKSSSYYRYQWKENGKLNTKHIKGGAVGNAKVEERVRIIQKLIRAGKRPVEILQVIDTF